MEHDTAHNKSNKQVNDQVMPLKHRNLNTAADKQSDAAGGWQQEVQEPSWDTLADLWWRVQVLREQNRDFVP